MTETTQPELASASPSRVTEILEAACRVIARDGAHGLHMKAVAKEAGVSKALVHYYIPTRKELLRRAIDHADTRAREQAEAELAPLRTGRARLERLLTAYAAGEPPFVESNKLWDAAWGSLMLDPELAPALTAGYRKWVDWIGELVVEAGADGSIPSDRATRNTAIRLTALSDGLVDLVGAGVVTPTEAARLVAAAIAEVSAA
jgi:AcrR family transcriptional regulator